MTGHLENNTGVLIPDITVRALDNETATQLYDATVSDDNGDFTLTDLPDGEICVMAVGDYTQDPPRTDTYTFNVPSNAQDRVIVTSDKEIGELIYGLLGIESRPETGAVFGEVYYYDGAGEEHAVGCATVTISVPGTVYYFEGALPSTTRTETDPNNSRFLLTHVDPGAVTITATLDIGKRGGTTLPVFATECATMPSAR